MRLKTLGVKPIAFLHAPCELVNPGSYAKESRMAGEYWEFAMTSIGEALRHERLRRGLMLEQVAAETKIASHHLKAMEEDRFDRLPGGLFTRSFLRQYTQTLGLDEAEVMEALKQLFPPEPAPEPKP